MRNVRKLKAEKLILAERYIYAIAVRCCALASRLSRATRAHTTAHSHARASAHPLPQHNNTHHDAAQAVPNITPKITALAFCDSFPLKLKGLTEKIAMLSDASDQILDSSDLMLVMETVLAIGNAMNDGTRTGSAAGFSLESLLKLTETRSKVKGALIWLWPATRRSALRLACCVLSLRRCLLPLTHRSSRRTPSLLHPHPQRGCRLRAADTTQKHPSGARWRAAARAVNGLKAMNPRPYRRLLAGNQTVVLAGFPICTWFTAKGGHILAVGGLRLATHGSATCARLACALNVALAEIFS